ncbi:preprotein translocase subunit YajC [Magnetospira sp. QH-2]|uniref:preprotein translocase subunit YajC n=1 Tax=Magnetospira sp. (strain QH-2) TaxID=1288970 RepID=UPI0003E81455|nr:preprotein translocase subunit YajC [Magnetospira sp. QH-2]CCQ73035.1 protein translocase subunit YajC [Magnetospira sp. QH-2]
MFFSPAYAQAAPAAGGGDLISGLLPMVLIFAVFYFLLIRPQQKRAKEHKGMLAALRRGDKIVTNGGIIGTISKVVSDEEVTVEIAEGIKVRIMRAMIAQVMAKTEPAANDDTGAADDNKDGGDGKGKGGGLKKLLGGK